MKRITLKGLCVFSILLLAVCGLFLGTTTSNLKEVYGDTTVPAVGFDGKPTVAGTEPIYSHTAEEYGSIAYAFFTRAVDGTITTYNVGDNRTPYVILSSTEEADAILFNTSLVFEFNTVAGANTIEGATSLTVAGYVNKDSYDNQEPGGYKLVVNKSNTTNVFINMSFNLSPTGLPIATLPNSETPFSLNPEQASGLYTFDIYYNYTDVEGRVSDVTPVISLSFYLVNYANYVYGGTGPIDVSNTTLYTQGAGDSFQQNYVFNYNYNINGELDFPFIGFDASKFGISIVYKTGYRTYNYTYDGVTKRYKNVGGEQVPYYTVFLRCGSTTYTFDTFATIRGEDEIIDYWASFSIEDFEKHIISKNYNSNCLGNYIINVSLLVESGGSYATIPAEEMPQALGYATTQYLTLFGFQATYKNQASKAFEELKNEVCEASFYANNSTSSPGLTLIDEDYGIDANIGQSEKTLVAVTDQAPVKFNYFGDVVQAESFYNIFSKHDHTRGEVLQSLKDYLADPDANNIFQGGRTFKPNTQFDADGIYVVKLVYEVTVGTGKVTGTQYLIFEIDRTAQALTVEGVDLDNTGNQTKIYDINLYTNKNLLVCLKYLENGFFAPVSVSYKFYQNFGGTQTASGIIDFKLDESSQRKIININSAEYFYFVTSQLNQYTFSNSKSGDYHLYIKSGASDVTSSYHYYLDNLAFENNEIQFYNVQKNDYGFVVADTNSKLSSNALSLAQINNTNSKLSYDLVVTDQSFTLSWKEKISGASSSAKVYYLPLNKVDVNNQANLYDLINVENEYWLTNGCQLGKLNKSFDEYINSRGFLKTALNPYSYFDGEGIYLFYVCDQAGNTFYRTILVDKSTSQILQGDYNKDEFGEYVLNAQGKRTWVNTFNTIDNPTNFVKKDTSLVFGTHKSMMLTNLVDNFDISIEDKSYLTTYNASTGASEAKVNIEFDFLDNILLATNYVRGANNSNYILGNSTNPTDFYLNIDITSINCVREVTNADLTVTRTEEELDVSQNWMVTIYADNASAKYSGESYYQFKATAKNNTSKTRLIEMNFDAVEGQYWAYGNSQTNDFTERYIRKNSATNLNVLTFKYLNNTFLSNAEYENTNWYEVGQLSYQYYPFNFNSDRSTYPFNSTATKSEDLLDYRVVSGKYYFIDSINAELVGGTTKTQPGKYILTRVYKGGGYLDADGTPATEQSNFCGEYYFDAVTNEYKKVEYGFDTFVRSYVVYVDHNGIISTEFVVGTPYKRLVGDNISITLSDGYQDVWTFKNFFRTTSTGIVLETNKLPVRINIPLSKYFEDPTLFCSLNFAKLDIKITFQSSNIYAPKRTWTIDKIVDGYCYCTALSSTTNPNGDLLFEGEGQYTITISDRTGYTDVANGNANQDPIIEIYKFTIRHTAPSGTFYVNEDELLNRLEDTNEFATNVKNEEDDDNNVVTFDWVDPDDPYTSKIKYLTLTAVDPLNNNLLLKTEFINLTSFSSEVAVDDAVNIIANPALSNAGTYILSLEHELLNSEIFDNKDYHKYAYSISLFIPLMDDFKDIKYTIDISYVTPDVTNHGYGNFVSSTYIVTIDRTRPNVNIDNLISTETYLTEFQQYTDVASNDFSLKEIKYYTSTDQVKELFKEEGVVLTDNKTLPGNTPTIYDYTFGVSNNYTLTYSSADTLTYFYFRSYNKYENNFISIAPDNDYYNDLSAFSNHPRFNPNNLISGTNVWYKALYSATPLKDIIAQTLATNFNELVSNIIVDGYYEVIERDLAGNYRVYTVYIKPSTEYFDLIDLNGTHLNGTYINVNNKEITATAEFVISTLQAKYGWATITLSNQTKKESNANYHSIKYLLTPYMSTSQKIAMVSVLNDYLSVNVNTRFSLTLNNYNPTVKEIVRFINIITATDSKLAKPTWTEVAVTTEDVTTITYTLNMPVKTEATPIFLEGLIIYKKGVVAPIYNNPYQVNNTVTTQFAGLSSGVYLVRYYDNYNRSNYYTYTVYPGITELTREQKYTVSSNAIVNTITNNYEYYDDGTNIYYGAPVTVTYETQLYKISVYRNDTYIDDLDERLASTPDREPSTDASAPYKYFDLTSTYDANLISSASDSGIGGVTNYTIYYYDAETSTLDHTQNIVIYDELPALYLRDDNGNPLVASLQINSSSLTNSDVQISWDSLLNYPDQNLNGIVATLYKQNEFGGWNAMLNLSNPSSNISDEGIYMIVLKNNMLGNSREAFFTIKTGELPFYTIISTNIDGVERELVKSDLSLNLNVAGIDTSVSPRKEALITRLTNYMLGSSLKTNTGSFVDSGVAASLVTKLNNGSIQTTDVEHYYTIDTPSIITNSAMNLSVIELYIVDDGNVANIKPSVGSTSYLTTFYIVYGSDPVYSNIVATTQAPISSASSMLQSFYFGSSTPFSGLSKTLTNRDVSNNKVTISWNTSAGAFSTAESFAAAKWFKKGNIVYLNYSYNNATSNVYGYNAENLNMADYNGVSSAIISGSGLHNLKFFDLAGNQYTFRSSPYTDNNYKLYMIDQIIYVVNNDKTILQHAIYNNNVSITLDKVYKDYYTLTTVTAYRNGIAYTDFTQEDGIYTFAKSGKYKVTLTGEYNTIYTGATSGTVTATYNFTIIERTSARLAYEFNEMSGYTIISVVKDNVDITSNIKAQSGSDVITNLFLSPNSFGNGKYKINMAIRYNDLLPEKIITYDLTINEAIPTITSEPGYGETTKGTVTLTYNPNLIYSELGKCSIRILVYNNDTSKFSVFGELSIDETALKNENAKQTNLTQTNDYYIQLVTDSGNVVLSFRVNRAEPLNTIAVIIIIIVAVTVIVVAIVFIKLRTRMRVR